MPFALPGQTIVTQTGGRRVVVGVPATGALGPELVTNGAFDNNGAGWTYQQGAGDFAGGQANMNGDTLQQQVSGVVAGASYRLSLTQGAGSEVIAMVNGGPGVNLGAATSASVTFTAGSTTSAGLILDDNSGISVIDNVSLKRVL